MGISSIISILQNILNIFNPRPIPAPTPVPQPPSDDFTQRLLSLHNSHRNSLGLKVLSLNTKLNSAAQKHSNWMNANKNLNHNEGSVGPGARLTNEGYYWRSYGENIAMGYSTPEQVFQGWLNSSGHRANIENPNFVDVGFGVSGTYWTTDFGSLNFSGYVNLPLGIVETHVQ